jgi:hypothetical protein
MSSHYRSLCLRLQARALYTSNGDHYPPVTEAQVEAAGARLGFQLPRVLCEIYTTVANGADFFGPGKYFHGIIDEQAGRESDAPTIEDFVGEGPRPFDTETVDLLRSYPGSYVLCDEGDPAGLVTLAHIGCNVYVHLDGFTGHLYLRDDHYENGEFVGGAYSWCALSLDEWLKRNLALSPTDTSEAKYQPRYPLAAILAHNGEGANFSVVETTPSHHERPLPKNASNVPQTSDAPDPRERLRLRLQSVREEIVRQIYQIDGIAMSAQRLGDLLTQEFANSQAVQRLADAEAQIYALEEDALFAE